MRELCVGLTAMWLVGCGNDGDDAKGPSAPTPDVSDAVTNMQSAMDRSVDPCDDFYRYACGSWIDATKLPADATFKRLAWGLAADANVTRLDGIMQDAVDHADADPDKLRIKTFFGSCVDEVAIDAAGLAPLEPYFDAIARIEDVGGTMRFLARLHGEGMNALFGLGTFVLPGGNTALILGPQQFPLGAKDTYLSDDATSVAQRNAYVDFVARLLELSGEPSDMARGDARTVVGIETALATVALSPADARDLIKLYHPTDLPGLEQSVPRIPWASYLAPLGLSGLTATINVTEPDYFARLEKLLSESPPGDIRTYLRWSVVQATAQDLPTPFRTAAFDFFDRTLAGRMEPTTRRRLCTDRTRAAIPDSVSKGYVGLYFAPPDREAATTMVESIKEAFRGELEKLSWVDDPTREWAIEKSRAMSNQIGYPDTSETYAGLALTAGSHFENVRAVARFSVGKALSLLGKVPDRAAWPWDAATTNAQYLLTTNTMNFPAGILQPPFFSRELPAFMNYGSIGVIMGHELTHGFDDQGRIFDANGVPGDTTWSDAVLAAFTERTTCIRNQFSGYEALPGLNVDGALTLGENIADLGGVRLSFRAYQKAAAASRERELERKSVVDGLTPEQTFFVAYAQTWCEVVTDEQRRQWTLTNPHSPNRYRVIGPLSNSVEFADAFDCRPGDAMVHADRCEVW